jgi:hypothetical protein
MKAFLLFVLLIMGMINKAQITGVTSYTSATMGFNYPLYTQRACQAPNGDIYMVGNNLNLARFSAGTYSAIPINIGTSGMYYNVFATSLGVWIYDELGEVLFYNGSTFVNHTSSIASLINTSNPNVIFHAGAVGNNVLFATKQGIIKYNGTTFSLITKSNSALPSDTVNCFTTGTSSIYVATDKGLCSYDGTSFGPNIQFTGASSHKAKAVFTNGVRTLVTRNDNSSYFNLYELNGNTLTRLPAYQDSAKFKSAGIISMCFVNNQPVFPGMARPRKMGSATNFTTYILPNNQVGWYVFPHPSNPNKFYACGAPYNFHIWEIDVTQYSNYDNPFDPHCHAFLDTNQVSAMIHTDNIKHWDIYESADPAYEVPKGSGAKATYATALWIGGLDNSNQLHIAAETYRQNGRDFWPGPVDTINASVNTVNGSPFNRLWKLSCNQINQFAANYNAANFSANNSPSFADINSYIGNGTPTNNFAKKLAPYKDWNGNNIYEPNLGDYPIIKGHQQVYAVYNDAYANHTETQGQKLGIEVHEKSYAFNVPSLPDSMQVINYTTFYNYEIYNRSNTNYNNVYVSTWVDCVLGYALDNRVGTDSVNGFGYIYNGANADPTSGGYVGYGNKLPMFAIAPVNCPFAQTDGIDNNNDGQIDESGEIFGLGKTTFYNYYGSPAATIHPTTTTHYYNYMSGKWRDNTPFTFGGNAYNAPGTTTANYVFTGNPQTNTGWTESSGGVPAGGRYMLVTMGPFNFPAKKKIEIEFAYVFSRDTSLNNVNNNLSLLQRDVKNIRYYVAQQNMACTPVVNVGLKENKEKEINIWMYPNPTQSHVTINLDYNADKARIKIFDITGRLLMEDWIRNSYTKLLDVSHYPSGIYFIEVSEGNSKAVEKLIKN